jgi:hypothetical protein
VLPENLIWDDAGGWAYGNEAADGRRAALTMAEGSSFILQLLARVWCKLWVASALAQWLPAMRPGERSVERFNKDVTFVVDAPSLQDSFEREALHR